MTSFKNTLTCQFVEEFAEVVAPFFPKVAKVNDVEKNEGDDNNGIVGRAIFVDIF